MAPAMGDTVLARGTVATDNPMVDTASNPPLSSKVNPRAVWAVSVCLLLVIIQTFALYPNPVLTRFPVSRCRCWSVGRSRHRRICRP